jgi:hypothetical protein
LGLRRIFHGKARNIPHVSSRKTIQNMKKKVNNQQVNNQQVNNNGCQHVQLGGMAFYDESKCFLFAPNEHGGGEKVQGFRSQGVAQQLSDGTFDFVVKPRIRSQAELIRKLAHGRLSKTKDGAIQLTLKVFCDEGINIGSTLVKEAEEAADALVEYQLKR